MENLKEKYYEKLKKEIEKIGYIDAELETYYVDDIKSEYLTAVNTTDEDDLENLANEFNEYIEEKISEDFVLLSSDHQWLKQVLVANELATWGDLTFSFPDRDMAYYVTQENAEKYENLYEFLMKEDLIFDEELREKFEKIFPEYTK